MAKTYTTAEKTEIVEEMIYKAMYDLEIAILKKFKNVDFDANIDGKVYNKHLAEIAKMYVASVKE